MHWGLDARDRAIYIRDLKHSTNAVHTLGNVAGMNGVRMVPTFCAATALCRSNIVQE